MNELGSEFSRIAWLIGFNNVEQAETDCLGVILVLTENCFAVGELLILKTGMFSLFLGWVLGVTWLLFTDSLSGCFNLAFLAMISLKEVV